jgi:hypothetical protein
VTRIVPADLPPGLRAVIKRDGRGNLTVYYARWLTPRQRRQAVRDAHCAARRGGWLRVLLPAPIAAVAAKAAAHPATWGSAVIVTVAGGLTASLAFTAPAPSPAQRLSPAGQVSATAAAHRHRRRREDEIHVPRPAPGPSRQHAPAPLPRTQPSPLLPLPLPTAPVTGSLSPPAVPSPAPTVCVTVLGLRTCVSAAA